MRRSRRRPRSRARVGAPGWPARAAALRRAFGDAAWDEMRSLVRVTRIEQPEAMLLAPEQAFFLRENLKLRLLNARLALLSRQFDTAQADLQAAHRRDRALLRPQRAQGRRRRSSSLRQVAAQARQVEPAAARRHARRARRRRRPAAEAGRTMRSVIWFVLLFARRGRRGDDARHQRRAGRPSTGAAGGSTCR